MIKEDSDEIYRGKVISLRKTMHTAPDGSAKQWDVVVHPGAVVIIAQTSDQKLLLLKQRRPVIQKTILEFPAGTLEEGEEPAACAARELEEEAGHRARTLISLGGFYSAPGFCTEYLHLFAASDLKKTQPSLDEDEEIELLYVPFDELKEMIKERRIQDAKTLAGFMLYEQWRKKQ